jgi:hypothetical protein
VNLLLVHLVVPAMYKAPAETNEYRLKDDQFFPVMPVSAVLYSCNQFRNCKIIKKQPVAPLSLLKQSFKPVFLHKHLF